MEYKYKIESVKVKHPELGELNKKVITYYDEKGNEVTKQHYIDEEKTPFDSCFKEQVEKGEITLKEKDK